MDMQLLIARYQLTKKSTLYSKQVSSSDSTKQQASLSDIATNIVLPIAMVPGIHQPIQRLETLNVAKVFSTNIL